MYLVMSIYIYIIDTISDFHYIYLYTSRGIYITTNTLVGASKASEHFLKGKKIYKKENKMK